MQRPGDGLPAAPFAFALEFATPAAPVVVHPRGSAVDAVVVSVVPHPPVPRVMPRLPVMLAPIVPADRAAPADPAVCVPAPPAFPLRWIVPAPESVPFTKMRYGPVTATLALTL